MFGRFLEISLTTSDIAASVQFYERLGFSHLTANDTWSHPYGVLSDGRLCIGLHQGIHDSPTLSFVLPELAQHIKALSAAGIELSESHLGEEGFHHVRLRDPGSQCIALLEARTFSPSLSGYRESLCGGFYAYSMASPADAGEAREFWERVGFVALEPQDEPYAHLPLTGDHLSLALHHPPLARTPLLVFAEPDMPARLERLQAAGCTVVRPLAGGTIGREHGLLEAPEGTRLLLLTSDP